MLALHFSGPQTTLKAIDLKKCILVFGVNFYFMNEIMLMSIHVSQPTSEQVSYDSVQ